VVPTPRASAPIRQAPPLPSLARRMLGLATPPALACHARRFLVWPLLKSYDRSDGEGNASGVVSQPE
jgi:hypothetical protein